MVFDNRVLQNKPVSYTAKMLVGSHSFIRSGNWHWIHSPTVWQPKSPDCYAVVPVLPVMQYLNLRSYPGVNVALVSAFILFEISSFSVIKGPLVEIHKPRHWLNHFKSTFLHQKIFRSRFWSFFEALDHFYHTFPR